MTKREADIQYQLTYNTTIHTYEEAVAICDKNDADKAARAASDAALASTVTDYDHYITEAAGLDYCGTIELSRRMQSEIRKAIDALYSAQSPDLSAHIAASKAVISTVKRMAIRPASDCISVSTHVMDGEGYGE